MSKKILKRSFQQLRKYFSFSNLGNICNLKIQSFEYFYNLDSFQAYSKFSKDDIGSALGSLCRKFAESELMPVASKLDKECQFPASQVTNPSLD